MVCLRGRSWGRASPPKGGTLMIQVKLLKKCKYGSKGAVVYVSRNEAHGLIDSGLAKIYKPQVKSYKNRMLETGK